MSKVVGKSMAGLWDLTRIDLVTSRSHTSPVFFLSFRHS